MGVVDELLAQCAECTTTHPAPPLRAATGAFLRWVREQPGIPAALLEALPRLPPHGASWLAIALGSAIEAGAPAETSGRALVALLRTRLAAIAAHDTGPQDEIVIAMPYLCQSVVAHVARLPALRSELADDDALLAALHDAEALTHGASWVHQLLVRTSGELVVIHAESRRVLALAFSNVGSAFHLFTLLQGAIGTKLPGGRVPSRAMVDAAEGHASGATEQDEAWWHYQDHQLAEPSIVHSIWAEHFVRDLPRLDGALVLVLWPKILGARLWGADFFGPALEAAPPSVRLERELDRAEAEAWLARVGIR